MIEHRLTEIEAEDGRAVVYVSTPEENDSDDSGWVTLRIIRAGQTIDALLEPPQARELAASLQKHADRA